MSNDVRYHFMLKQRTAVTNEILLQFMDFIGARIITLTVDELNRTRNQKLKADARLQWTHIQKAHPRNPIK